MLTTMHPAATFHRRPEMQSASLTHIHIHCFPHPHTHTRTLNLFLSSSRRTRQSVAVAALFRVLPPPQAHNVQYPFTVPTNRSSRVQNLAIAFHRCNSIRAATEEKKNFFSSSSCKPK